MAEPDILADCAGRLIKAGVDSAVVIKTIAEMRRVWGGDAVYIHTIDRDSRDKAISDALTAGLPMAEVAKKAGCHPITVRRKKAEWLL